MQRKAAENLIARTRHLVGRTLKLQVLDRDTGELENRRFRVLANDHIVNLKDPSASRVCLDVYVEAEDAETGRIMHLSLDKLRKQRLD